MLTCRHRPTDRPDPKLVPFEQHTYYMGKYEVTLGQYVQFLDAVAKTDTYGLFNANMSGAAGLFPFGIRQSGSPGNFTYSVTGANPNSANMPLYCETWGDAARFCNWLQKGQPTGPEGNGTTETGAYTLNGATSNAALMAVTRNSGAQFYIPAVDEWYKAAFYKTGGTNAGYWHFATQSDTAHLLTNVLSATGTNNANFFNGAYTDPTNHLTPVGYFAGSPSAYGTYDQAGDLFE